MADDKRVAEEVEGAGEPTAEKPTTPDDAASTPEKTEETEPKKEPDKKKDEPEKEPDEKTVDKKKKGEREVTDAPEPKEKEKNFFRRALDKVVGVIKGIGNAILDAGAFVFNRNAYNLRRENAEWREAYSSLAAENAERAKSQTRSGDKETPAGSDEPGGKENKTIFMGPPEEIKGGEFVLTAVERDGKVVPVIATIVAGEDGPAKTESGAFKAVIDGKPIELDADNIVGRAQIPLMTLSERVDVSRAMREAGVFLPEEAKPFFRKGQEAEIGIGSTIYVFNKEKSQLEPFRVESIKEDKNGHLRFSGQMLDEDGVGIRAATVRDWDVAVNCNSTLAQDYNKEQRSGAEQPEAEHSTESSAGPRGLDAQLDNAESALSSDGLLTGLSLVIESPFIPESAASLEVGSKVHFINNDLELDLGTVVSMDSNAITIQTSDGELDFKPDDILTQETRDAFREFFIRPEQETGRAEPRGSDTEIGD